MVANHILLAVFWILYCIVHSVFADLTIKKKIKKIMGKSFKYYRLIYTIFAFVSFIALLWFGVSVSSFLLYKRNNSLIIAGMLIAFFGLIIMIACILTYLPKLSGIKNITKKNFSNELIVTGMHSFVRHPLYSGTFLFLWGSFIVFPYLSFLISNIIITTYTLIGIQLEEKKLELEFGESYKQYQKKVPKLIPALKIR
ncbi:MAG: isoprenylcysteine carboxylmethyltransferase family protein [Chitinophagaceae bacterium]